ncbi:DUF2514 domain-containing protein [Enterobacteriaceae bacterium 4M9]|nr:DUF2514 domain-containing protein [Enterobacteriaceae bacterium 4M9]
MALLLIALYTIGYQQGSNTSERHWKLRWSERDAAQAQRVAKLEARNRAEEQRRRDEMEQVTQHAEQQLATLRADTAVARGAAERLRRTLSELQRRNASPITSAGNTSSTGGAGCSVLADVLTESVERNQQLAAEADRRRIAGLACERAYNSLIQSQ